MKNISLKNKALYLAIGLVAFGFIYKTKGFGILKPKGQKNVDIENQENIIFEVDTDTGQTVPTDVNLLSESQANNKAVNFHDTLSKAWGYAWTGFMPTVQEYVNAVKPLVDLSNQQLAQVVNAFNKKYKTDTYNTVRKMLTAVSVTSNQPVQLKSALLSKLTEISA